MNVRWLAVITGFFVDYMISVLLVFFAPESLFTAPDITHTGDLVMICLLTLSTGIGGYVAGRIARTSRPLNGLLVAVVGILIGQLQGPIPRLFVIASAISCLLAALGGYLSRYPQRRTQGTTGQ